MGINIIIIVNVYGGCGMNVGMLKMVKNTFFIGDIYDKDKQIIRK